MILISAFEPFDIDPENSTELILSAFLKQPQAQIQGIVLPVSFARAWPMLRKEIDRVGAQTVIAIGQADSRGAIGVEQVALNWRDARLKDADAAQPIDREIVAGGPVALRTRLESRALVDRLRREDFSAELSYTAGTFVCNALMFSLLEWAHANQRCAGFIHFPLLLEQKVGVGREAHRPPRQLTLARGVRALEIVIEMLKK